MSPATVSHFVILIFSSFQVLVIHSRASIVIIVMVTNKIANGLKGDGAIDGCVSVKKKKNDKINFVGAFC